MLVLLKDLGVGLIISEFVLVVGMMIALDTMEDGIPCYGIPPFLLMFNPPLAKICWVLVLKQQEMPMVLILMEPNMLFQYDVEF